VGDAGVRSERREIQQLPDPAGAEFQHALESDEIADVEEVPDVPLEVRPASDCPRD